MSSRSRRRSATWLLATWIVASAGAATTNAVAGEARASRPKSSSGAAGTRAGTARSSADRPVGAKTRAGGRSSWRQGGVVRLGRGYYGHGRYHPWSYGHYGFYGHYGYPYWWWYPPVPTYVFVGDGASLPAVVETAVRPRRARVSLDGEDVGRAKDYSGRWDELLIPPGRHVLEFTKDGFRTLRIELDARAGQVYRLEHRLEPGDGPDPRSVSLGAAAVEPLEPTTTAEAPPRNAPPAPGRPGPSADAALERGLLSLHVAPDDAVVYLDGAFLATAAELRRLHGALPVASGVHRVEVARPGYRTAVREVAIEGDAPVRVEIRLEPE